MLCADTPAHHGVRDADGRPPRRDGKVCPERCVAVDWMASKRRSVGGALRTHLAHGEVMVTSRAGSISPQHLGLVDAASPSKTSGGMICRLRIACQLRPGVYPEKSAMYRHKRI